MSRKKKVFIGMSGGVDSSVAALLLKRRGYDVTGVYMRSYNLDGCSDQDARDARRTAETIGIPFYVWDFEKMYKENVVDYIVKGYASGITPNPDVVCNRDIKFGAFYKKAMQLEQILLPLVTMLEKTRKLFWLLKTPLRIRLIFCGL